MNLNMTYCVNTDCPLRDCERHPEKLKLLPVNVVVNVADLGGVCDRYIGYLVECVEGGEN